MLHENGRGRPNVRALIYREHLAPHAEDLAGWARRVNVAGERGGGPDHD